MKNSNDSKRKLSFGHLSPEFLIFLAGILLGFLTSTTALFYSQVSIGNGPFDLEQFKNTVQALGSGFIAFGAFVALASLMSNQRRHREEDARNQSEKLLAQYELLLQNAYETFTIAESSNPTALPNRSRTIWLSVARMIIRARELKKRITEGTHLIIAEEHTEYWRLKFLMCFTQNSESFTYEYFKKDDNGDCISKDSIVIILFFIRDSKNIEADIIDEVDMDVIIESVTPDIKNMPGLCKYFK